MTNATNVTTRTVFGVSRYLINQRRLLNQSAARFRPEGISRRCGRPPARSQSHRCVVAALPAP
jgi:hypothetical protein